ncbi:hypothetical protein SeGA_5730, partial [Salmonella enterica subsp. enterica serovar Gaminara str. A4-567]
MFLITLWFLQFTMESLLPFILQALCVHYSLFL